DCLASSRVHRHSVAGSSNHDEEIAQPEAERRRLPGREIQFGAGCLIKAGVFDISHHPHDRAPLVLVSRANAAANRTVISIEVPRHCLIYHNYGLRAGAITLVQQAAIDQPNLHRFEITRRYGLPEVYVLGWSVRTHGDALNLSVISVDPAYRRQT